MKTKNKVILSLGLAGLALLLLLSGGLLASGGFDIPWWTVDGGGGQSSGANFTISGSIGQPDAGQSSDGTYSVEGGFWRGGENLPPTPDNRIYLPSVHRD